MWTRLSHSIGTSGFIEESAELNLLSTTENTDLLRELSLEEQLESLDQFLRIQNLRRAEEEKFHHFMRGYCL